MGVRLAVDDFGTGYSSLGYLKRLPIHMLKIDRSFVSELHGDSEDLAIAKAVIALAARSACRSSPRGSSTTTRLAFLLAEGCHYAQGYLFGRPLEGADFARHWAPAGAAPLLRAAG